METRRKQLSKSLKARISTDPMSVADLYSQPDDHDICEPLVRALQDRDKIVRHAAIDALICLNDMYASSSILWMLLHGNIYAREAAARVLAFIGKGDLLAIRYLGMALNDPDSLVRDAAADALISVNL
jgi:HEAT repeat protein